MDTEDQVSSTTSTNNSNPSPVRSDSIAQRPIPNALTTIAKQNRRKQHKSSICSQDKKMKLWEQRKEEKKRVNEAQKARTSGSSAVKRNSIVRLVSPRLGALVSEPFKQQFNIQTDPRATMQEAKRPARLTCGICKDRKRLDFDGIRHGMGESTRAY